MTQILITLINFLQFILVLLVIVSVILSYFMDPYHPVRRMLDRIVEPMLAPIRRVVPLVGMIDFSPLILIVLVQLIGNLLIRLLLSLR
ncbi:MAG TPA: YggT family protein [Anaerolineales bacterium]|nr:YggT family protein [Anaerolineales bacterium]